MACLLVPAAEAVLTTIVTKVVKAKEKKLGVAEKSGEVTLPFSKKLKWLSNLLWGGAALLALEHIWHGEIVPFFPFLTAASNPADAAAMLHEMATVGVTMAVVCTVVWCGMLAVSHIIEKREPKSAPEVQ
ncbi:MAG: hypothetical protein WCQ72_03505 [Eubacteriales bacterium]